MNHVGSAAIVLATTLIVGCATVKETYAPDGRKAYTLNCSGAARGWDKCFSAAGEICKDAGFDVLDRTSEELSGGAVSGSTSGNVGGAGIKTSERAMIVACKR